MPRRSPKIPLHALSLVLFRVLASQGAATYILAAGALLLAVTAPLNYLFIWTLGWGLDGSALAAVACEAIYAAALVSWGVPAGGVLTLRGRHRHRRCCWPLSLRLTCPALPRCLAPPAGGRLRAAQPAAPCRRALVARLERGSAAQLGPLPVAVRCCHSNDLAGLDGI